MKKRVKKYEDVSPLEFLLLREKLGIGRYRKTLPRETEKERILLNLALRRMEEKEKDDYIVLGKRKRKLSI